jgi:hypothetical protein
MMMRSGSTVPGIIGERANLRRHRLIVYEIKMRPTQYVQGNVPDAEPSTRREKLAVEALVVRWKGNRPVRCDVNDDDGSTRKVDH